MTTLKSAVLATALLTALSTGAAMAAELSVTITDLRNDQGLVRCAVFNSAESFGKPGLETASTSAPISNGRAQCNFASLPPGTYAIGIFHAENNETELTTGLFGIPKLGVGFSNNPSLMFGPPGFDKLAFTLADQPLATTIKMQYF